MFFEKAPIWGFMKVILGFTQVSARSINKVKGKKNFY